MEDNLIILPDVKTINFMAINKDHIGRQIHDAGGWSDVNSKSKRPCGISNHNHVFANVAFAEEEKFNIVNHQVGIRMKALVGRIEKICAQAIDLVNGLARHGPVFPPGQCWARELG